MNKLSVIIFFLIPCASCLSATFVLNFDSLQNDTENAYVIRGLTESDYVAQPKERFQLVLPWDSIDSLENLAGRTSVEINYQGSEGIYKYPLRNLNSWLLYDSFKNYIGCFFAAIDEEYQAPGSHFNVELLIFFKKAQEQERTLLASYILNKFYFISSSNHPFKVHLAVKEEDGKGLKVSGSLEKAHFKN